MQPFTFIMALLMGLTGSLHCAGMCGPIVWMMPFQLLNGFKKAAGIALYHAGRITVYALLALVLHSFKSLFHPEWQRYISITLGCLLLIGGLRSFLSIGKQYALPWAGWVRTQLGRLMLAGNITTLFFTGMLNGMLPCGLVYMALSASITATNAVTAMGMMYVFGLGTMPALIAITLLKQKASFLRHKTWHRLVPVAMFVLGSMFVLRGMNLGIPYLSPKIIMEQTVIKSSCCHR